MADFRRWITALAVLALFAGLATAQVNGSGGGNALTCSAQNSGSVTPLLRSEGYTEEVGDVVVTCTGGPVYATGTAAPQANITVFLNTTVTSRLLTSSSATEALLLIDEPGSGLTPVIAGFGPGEAQTLCTNYLTGCPAFSYVQTVGTAPYPTAVTTATGTTAAPNVFQGVLTGNNQITFFGVPVLPPGTSAARVFRITNVRANANLIGGASGNGTSQVIASISFSGATSLPIQNPTQVVGFIESGLATGVTSASDVTKSLSSINFSQCTSASKYTALATLDFKEKFGTAFKTRLIPTASVTTLNQNVPGAIYNSESNFTFAATGGIAGLADFGTRLKAVFNNIPAGVNIYVSTTNVTAATGTAAASTALTYAQLLTSETAPETYGVPAASATATLASGVGVAALPIVGGQAVATWEVVNTQPNTIEDVYVGVYISYTASPATNSPTPGTGTVNMSYAPTPTNGAFTAAAGAAASSSLPIPRFADTSTATNVLTISICQTALLYPFVTNQAGFDTGIAISNTSTDPFGTAPQAGSCTLNFYGAAAPAAVNSGVVATGTTYATLASTSAPGFQGYVIAVCNFQYAHGFAFVSDVGARNLAMGYLALVMDNGTRLTRGPSASEYLSQ